MNLFRFKKVKFNNTWQILYFVIYFFKKIYNSFSKMEGADATDLAEVSYKISSLDDKRICTWLSKA